MIHIHTLSHENTHEIHHINQIYQQTWDDSIQDRFLKHSQYEGFSCKVLKVQDKVIGFSYGYSSLEGQYYHNLLKEHLNSKTYQIYLADSFEFVELIVLSEYRGNGYGTLLIQEMIKDITHKNIILTTQYDNSGAQKLYRRLGWTTVSDSLFFGEDRFVIMIKINK